MVWYGTGMVMVWYGCMGWVWYGMLWYGMVVWLYGCMVVWLYGCMVVWDGYGMECYGMVGLYGCMG